MLLTRISSREWATWRARISAVWNPTFGCDMLHWDRRSISSSRLSQEWSAPCGDVGTNCQRTPHFGAFYLSWHGAWSKHFPLVFVSLKLLPHILLASSIHGRIHSRYSLVLSSMWHSWAIIWSNHVLRLLKYTSPASSVSWSHVFPPLWVTQFCCGFYGLLHLGELVYLDESRLCDSLRLSLRTSVTVMSAEICFLI